MNLTLNLSLSNSNETTTLIKAMTIKENLKITVVLFTAITIIRVEFIVFIMNFKA